MGSRVYVGRLSYRAHERDIERFFRGYGRITEILLKNGYAFVEFSDRRDAEDAVHDLNGRSLLGDRVIVQNAKSRPRGRDMYRERMRERSRSRDRRRSRSRDRKRSHSRDRKKRRHSSSESESPEDNRRRSSSRSQSPSPKKSFKKSNSDRKRKRDRSSSSRSPSPDAKKSKDKRKERKYRSSSEKEGSAERGGTNASSIIVRGFDNKGKFEKWCINVNVVLQTSTVRSRSSIQFIYSFVRSFVRILTAHSNHSVHSTVSKSCVLFMARRSCIHLSTDYATVSLRDALCSGNSFRNCIARPRIIRLKHIAKKYGDLTDFEMRDDNTWYVFNIYILCSLFAI
uniref:RRM domain-containing protein n=1 Tax=Elaeophora elaphi TaxID=1147741 RepID=A0A0R3S3C8_9BILA